MSLIIVFIVVVLVIVIVAVPLSRRSHIDRLITDLNRSEDDEELARAEEEVRNLEAMATPEDAEQQLPDWGPGAPRKRKR